MGAGVAGQAVGRVKQFITHVTHKLVALMSCHVVLQCARVSEGLLALLAAPPWLTSTVGQLVPGDAGQMVPHCLANASAVFISLTHSDTLSHLYFF